jgi:hypothetical protein
MSLLYPENAPVEVDVLQVIGEQKISLVFYCNGGKYGTKELLDGYDLSPKELLDILQNHFNNQ